MFGRNKLRGPEDYSYRFVDANDLIERLQDTLTRVYDVESEMAVKDAILYIERHFFYDR